VLLSRSRRLPELLINAVSEPPPLPLRRALPLHALFLGIGGAILGVILTKENISEAKEVAEVNLSSGEVLRELDVERLKKSVLADSAAAPTTVFQRLYASSETNIVISIL